MLRHFDIELLEPTYATNYKKILAAPYQPCRVRYRRKKNPLVQVLKAAG